MFPVVLSIGKLAASGGGHGRRGVEYYLSRVASGIEDYYTGAGEAPGEWVGSGAAELGLSGRLSAEDLRALMDGRHPRTGEVLLGGGPGRPRSVPAFDLTFSAPKSVSLLYAFGDPYVRQAVIAAHERAVRASLYDYLESHAIGARRGTDGVEKLQTSGAVAAAFRHRTSRAGDPDLHTHVLVANLVHASDGRWSCLDSALLYTHAKAAGVSYQAQLRHELTRTLGVAWGPVHNGCADVAGIDRSVIDTFSERATEIKAELERRGETGMRASHVAALATRRAKDYDVAAESLEARWAEQGRAVGFGGQDIPRLLDRSVDERPTARQWETAYDHLASPEGLTRGASTYTRRDVVIALAERLPAGTTVRELERRTDAYLASDRAVLLADPLVGHTADHTLRVRHGKCEQTGRLVGVDSGEDRYSTPDMIATEQRVLAAAVDGRGAGRGVAQGADVERSLERRPTLSDEQRAMVRVLTTSGDAVEVVAAAAGSGKTYALDAAREAWQASGIRVIGAGLAARYAAELQAGAGIDSFTLDSLLSEFRNPLSRMSRPVFVIDEANTVGTRKLAELFRYATDMHAKVVLVGDPHQLAEIDAGGAFRALASRLGAHELSANFRQRHAWEREALSELRTGDVDRALAAYASHGAIVCAETAGAVRERLVADYLAARSESQVAMFAPRRADAEDLNRRTRALLFERGELTGPDVVFGGRGFVVGDVVMATRNDRWAGVINGTRGVVSEIDAEQGTLSMRIDAGTDITLGSRYLDAGHLTHAYATTAHKVEGMTVDRAFFLGDPTVCREMGYVAMSRGREANHFYVVAPEQPTRRDDFGDRHQELLGELARGLGRSATKTMAVDIGGEVGLAARSFRDLLAERDALRQSLLDGAPSDPRQRLEQVSAVRRRCAESLDHARQEQDRFDSLSKRERKHSPQRGDSPKSRARQWAARVAEADADIAQLRRQGEQRQAYFDARSGDVERYRLLNRVIDTREGKAISRALADPPRYLTDALGPRPDTAKARAAWTEGVAVVERHRLAFGITDPERPLGREPERSTDRYWAHREADRKLDSASHDLARAGVEHHLSRERNVLAREIKMELRIPGPG